MIIQINYNCSAISFTLMAQSPFSTSLRTRTIRYTNYDLFSATVEKIAQKYTYVGAYDGGWIITYEKGK